MDDGTTRNRIGPSSDTSIGSDEGELAPIEQQRIDLAALRRSLAGRQGPEYWQSLDQLAETPEFRDYLEHEFPAGADAALDDVTRRHFLKVMGASIALAGISACTVQPEEKILPYVKSPEQIIPGRPVFYASSVLRSGYAEGVLVESHMGRPTKIEGNPDHPASLGGTNVHMQAAVLGLYDPDRSKAVMQLGGIGNWTDFIVALTTQLDTQKPKRGAGLRILTETVTSPTLADQLRRIRLAFPESKWHQYNPIDRDAARAGNSMNAGRNADAIYHFDRADVIVSLDADFLLSMPGSVRYARDFISRRRVNPPADPSKISRLYVVESTPSITGAMADHRLALRAADIDSFARALAGEFGISAGPGVLPQPVIAWAKQVAADLKAHNGAAVVVPGDPQSAFVHDLAHRINAALGATGSIVEMIPPVEPMPVVHGSSLSELMTDIDAGKVEVLLILGGNPVYTAPADLKFADRFSTVKFRAHLSLYEDETSRLSHWHIPAAHTLEMWSDAKAYDGTVSIIQPLIASLYGGHTPHELLAILTQESGKTNLELIRGYWQTQGLGGDFDTTWHDAIGRGVLSAGLKTAPGAVLPPPGGLLALSDTTAATGAASASAGAAAPAVAAPGSVAAQADTFQPPPVRRPSAPPPPPAPADASEGDLEIVFRPDPHIWDGSYANNAWLQELPKPISKLTWDNAAFISPATAEKLELATGDMVELAYQGRAIKAPVMVIPGQADGSVTVFFGYGRDRAGQVGSRIGYNAYALRTSDAPWYGFGLSVNKVGDRFPLATTQHHFTMDGRDLIRAGSIEDLRANPSLAPEGAHEGKGNTSFFPEYRYDGYKWGMAIDINACIGCNACVMACVAENNVPVVGKEQVLRGREMHWLRVDTYFKGAMGNPDTYFQPIPCMQCETAPCEVVCPVHATVHSHEGLNDMVYNRCIGTRYCSNNCPYKVRRFNFFNFTEDMSESERLGRNPDVTIRSRGVMEKCTYCVQRINYARIDAKRENRRIADGEIETACQASCPTGAIAFGDLNDAKSKVVAWKSEHRNYPLLPELNTQPRTTYLGRVHNPNSELGNV